MRRLLISAATGLAAVCLVGGCTTSAQQPPPVIGDATQGPVASPSADTGAAKGTGTGSNVGLSSSQLNAAITSATAQATSVHVTGTATAGGSPLTLDARLNKNGSVFGHPALRGRHGPVPDPESIPERRRGRHR